MKKNVTFICVMTVFIVLFSLPAIASETPIFITNPSFEDYDPFTMEVMRGKFNLTVLDWFTTGTTGTFMPSTPGNSFGYDVFSTDVPDGTNTAFSRTGSIYQTLGANLAADTTYTLQVDVGNRLDLEFAAHSVDLRADGTILASASANPLSGHFSTAAFSYTTTLSDPIGSPIEIWLNTNTNGNTTAQVNWDNVQLNAITATVSVAPEPISSVLFVTGGAALGIRSFLRKRSQKVS